MTLLEELEAAGAVVAEEGGRVRIRAPQGSIPPGLRARLDKKALLHELRQRAWQRFLDKCPGPTEDPRPDLAEDSAWWSRLLTLAHERDEELGGILHGFRCLGRRLRRRDGGVVLGPADDAADVLEYQEDRARYLLPSYTSLLTALLTQLSEEVVARPTEGPGASAVPPPAGPASEVFPQPCWVGEEHNIFWQRPGDGGWVCAVCHPPVVEAVAWVRVDEDGKRVASGTTLCGIELSSGPAPASDEEARDALAALRGLGAATYPSIIARHLRWPTRRARGALESLVRAGLARRLPAAGLYKAAEPAPTGAPWPANSLA